MLARASATPHGRVISVVCLSAAGETRSFSGLPVQRYVRDPFMWRLRPVCPSRGPLRFPLRLRFQSPLIIEPIVTDESAAEGDQQGRRLTPYQAYACRRFGSACHVALAIQRAENPRGDCEIYIYHYDADGTLDWGYFQIHTVQLDRPGLNLRDLLYCKANIDFACQLYLERGFTSWSPYNNGAYPKFLRDQ
jgi:hypothetical protein